MESNFKISPRVLAHLGEDLIKNESIAILELVKNSYDACASVCNIKFDFRNEKLNTIIIEDNGLGMDLHTINDVWLVIGTDNKKDTSEPSPCQRVPLGEKGIGRLGIHKLGKKIELISKKRNAKEVKLFIDWTKLDEIKKIRDFHIEVTENEIPEVFDDSTGTRIIIKDLKTDWNRKLLRDVYRSINSLNSPFDSTNDDFKVNIDSNTDVFEGLPDFEDIKKAALYFAKCKIKDDRIIEFKYEFKPWRTLTRISEGRIKTEKDFDDFQLRISRKKDSGREIEYFSLERFDIGTIEFEVAIFDNDSVILNYANTEKKSVRDYLSENGGIRVYRDGVRVYDYGEKENDWLGIDLRRIHKVGGNISNHIIIGAVNLEDRSKSSDLKEKTNREGFVENEAYSAFKDAVSFALDLIVSERNVDKNKLTVLYKKHKTIEPVLSDLNEVIELVEKKVREKETKDEILSYLSRINVQYKEVKSILIKSANAGLNLSVVIHEIEKLTASLIGSIHNNKIERAINLALHLEKIIQGYSVMLKNSAIRRGKLSDIVSIAFDNYEFRFKDHNVTPISNDSDLQAFYAKSEAVSVLTNLLDNSLFWLSYSRTENRAISAFITDQINGYYSIVVSDNGPGFKLPPEVAVKPFVTGKPHALGSGLGLHIADEMMKAMNGQLMFLDENDIKLPEKTVEHGATKAIVALCFRKEKR